MKKRILIILGLIIIVSVVLFLKTFFGPKYSDGDFNIETYYSSVDKDADGIDDQTDILQSAKEYLNKKPKYESKYYGGGYPDDNYGVCTDVIAFALKGAGYDLRELVNQDILNNPQLYQIENVDKNIDFRRVDNLKIYFQNTAIQLSNDVKDIASWQGGDIVIFENHIGLVSDKRNEQGISLVLHHYSPLQISYEEDILPNANNIVGHYRIS